MYASKEFLHVFATFVVIHVRVALSVSKTNLCRTWRDAFFTCMHRLILR